MKVPIVEQLREVVKELAQPVDFIAAVVLFGSIARGEAKESSDVDLFVLTKGLSDLPSIKGRSRSTKP